MTHSKRFTLVLLAAMAALVAVLTSGAAAAQAIGSGGGIVHNKHVHCVRRSTTAGPVVTVCYRINPIGG